MDNAIIGFVDEYEYLNTHYNSKLFDFNEYKFRNAESAFQSQKNIFPLIFVLNINEIRHFFCKYFK